jgi:hypothetical protein
VLTGAAAFVGVAAVVLVPSPWGYVVFGALLALPISLAVGRGWWRQLALVLAGFALVGVFYVYALAAGCPPDARECAPEIALVVGGFVLAGWLAGIGAVSAARGLRSVSR